MSRSSSTSAEPYVSCVIAFIASHSLACSLVYGVHC
jgi:hypothetical protein